MPAHSSDPRPTGILALVGPRGAGKSELGRRAAARVACAFVDLDLLLARVGRGLAPRGAAAGPATGRAREDVGDLLVRVGPDRFRWLERTLLGALLGTPAGCDRELPTAFEGWCAAAALAELDGVAALAAPAVLATGGGAVEDPASRDALGARALTVWIDAPADVLAARIRSDAVHRPALIGRDPADEVGALRARRAPHYAACARARLVNDGADPDAAALRLFELWLGLDGV